MDRFTGLIGLAVILGVAYLASNNRKAIKPRVLLWGMGLQLAFAFLVLKTGAGYLFQGASVAVNALLEYAEAGSRFVFDGNRGWNGEMSGTSFGDMPAL